MKVVFNPNIPIFPPNSAEGLNFSPFHSASRIIYISMKEYDCALIRDHVTSIPTWLVGPAVVWLEGVSANMGSGYGYRQGYG